MFEGGGIFEMERYWYGRIEIWDRFLVIYLLRRKKIHNREDLLVVFLAASTYVRMES